MIIGFTLDGVLRDHLSQLEYVFGKYLGAEPVDRSQVTSTDLTKYFPIQDEIKLRKFMYHEHALEIFGHADQMEDNIFNDLNQFVEDINDDGEHSVVIVSREADRSIPATMFFISKVGCKVQHYHFTTTYADVWNYADIVVSAQPEILKEKPTGKLSIKINTPYNTGIEGDLNLDSVKTLFNDRSYIEKLLGKKIITL